ncbi:hypothetical protein TTHERM_00149420 (macronuclear) [Tetrahymena thermophila SB210]|uniref:Uncharacterized protein n=1 Tax=Tetrahymena thermophila (strain SB210) TaxID=312017 RepID=I7M2U7_TETTS|nr:hypothetical protein TTHERM_00149420 [Tetrahymena thermophila SB210]EAS01332.2 hypothetical protein TTHERM_00149420 [Tetrahymena thermophila SB210]|eukprot:XP_001021577.2 hypothetical protein TTHERM_00149420 [Tetrahymena thermophila SB210]
MSAKLKTFEDIWKNNIGEKAKKYESDQTQYNKDKLKTEEYERKSKGVINQNIQQNKSQNNQDKVQKQNDKQSGLLNEKDWEYLDRLGEKFRILEEKSSNQQKEFQSSLKNMKGDNNNNQKQQQKDAENLTYKMDNIRCSPSKEQIYNQQKKNIDKEQKQKMGAKQNYETTIIKQSQSSNEKSNISTQRIVKQENIDSFSSKQTLKNNYIQDKMNQEQFFNNTKTQDIEFQDNNSYECTFKPNDLKNSYMSCPQSEKEIQNQRSRNLTPNHLYEDAVLRKQKQEQMEKQMIKETKKQTNQSKIGVNSQKIILSKIEEFLQALIASIEEDDDDKNPQENQYQEEGDVCKDISTTKKKVLKFEGVGFFFQQLGIFRSVKFEENENGDISISQLKGLNNIEIERMKQEMTFHEELWKIMSIDQLQYKEPEEIESISSKCLFDITMVLLELKLTVQQSELLLNEIILCNLFSEDFNRGQEVVDIYFSVQHNWTLEQLVKNFRQIFDDKTTLMDFYANWNKKLAVQSSVYENSEMSFHPQINQRSRVMDSMIQQSKSCINQKRHEILFDQHKIKQEKQQQQKVEKLQKEVQQCTFKPQTNVQKMKEQRSKNSKYNQQEGFYDNQEDEQQQYEENQKRYEQLFKIHNRKQNQIKEIKEYVEFYRQEQELEQCTFQPQTSEINKEMLQEGQLQNIKGLNQQLQRMYKARKEKLEKEMFFEKQRYLLSQQNQKQGSKKVLPFSFDEKNQKKKLPQEERKLIGHVDINITKTKKGKITLHEGDNASELAYNFSKIYNISSEMTETLSDMLQQYLDKYYEQKTQK